jgi:hypothetical protein
MEVDKVVETPDGKVEFHGRLEGKELETVISIGLHYLLQVGALVHLEKDKTGAH